MVDITTTVEPFGATVNGVWSLVPEAKLFDGTPDELPVGQYAITIDQVYAWVEEISGTVAMLLTGWQRLNHEPVAPETTSDRAQLIEYARTVIHNGAGSYLEAARHPERATRNDTSYAAVLWDRYTTGLDRLAAWLKDRLAAGETDDTGDTPTVEDGAAFAFPCPTFADRFPL